MTNAQLLTPEARKNNLRLLAGFMAAATVGAVACIAVSTPAPTPTAGPDWRAKVGQATPAELAAQPKLAKPEAVPTQAQADAAYAQYEVAQVKAAASQRMVDSVLDRCDRDWLPSTCAKLRAEFAAAGR